MLTRNKKTDQIPNRFFVLEIFRVSFLVQKSYYNYFIQPYKKLFTFWFSVIIYDRTVEFCEREIRSWKLKEQMNGAARSGKQNIVEGSDNLTTSIKVCIKLTGIAKSSIEELIGDLEDFLRQRKLEQWQKMIRA